MWKKIIMIIGLVALTAAQVKAQSLSLGPQVGYYKAQDADQGSYLGGAALRLKLGAVGVEASITSRQEYYANGALSVHSWPVMLTGLFYPLPIVYGAMGFGWYNVTVHYNQSILPSYTDETIQKVGWHFGAGVELPLGSNIELIGDIRYVFLNYNFKAFPGSTDLKSNFSVITFGLLFGL
jgi:opacity protein-like surface antigen